MYKNQIMSHTKKSVLPSIDFYTNLCHIGHMTTVSIRDLHLRTGYYVRSAAMEPLAVTERGKVIAILQMPSMPDLKVQKRPKKSLSDLVAVKKSYLDSTQIISEDRDRE